MSEITTSNGGALALLNDERVRETVLSNLPDWVDRRLFVTAALDVFNDRKLQRYPASVKLRALATCASFGLYPGQQEHVYLVPRGQELTVQVGFRGYAFLARQQDGVSDVTVHLVHTGDVFEVESTGPDAWRVAKHDRDPLVQRYFRFKKGIKLSDTGLRGAYIIKHLDDGSLDTWFIPGQRLLDNLSCAQTDAIAKKWPERFYRKTAMRAAWADEFFVGSTHGINDAGARLRRHDIQEECVSKPPVKAVTTRDAVMTAVQDPDDAFQIAYIEGSRDVANDVGCAVEEVDKAVCKWMGCEDPTTLGGDDRAKVINAFFMHISGTEPFPHLDVSTDG